LLLAKDNSLTKKNPKLIIFKAIANQSLGYIACIFFGLPSDNNELNVLDRIPLTFDLLYKVVGMDLIFKVNGNEHLHYYLLIDGIYPC
jgi:hypothetical protein